MISCRICRRELLPGVQTIYCCPRCAWILCEDDFTVHVAAEDALENLLGSERPPGGIQ